MSQELPDIPEESGAPGPWIVVGVIEDRARLPVAERVQSRRESEEQEEDLARREVFGHVS